jgi:hypothetical protein
MANELGAIEIDCDAPDYAVVRASRALGFRDPLDVRWCRLGHLPAEPRGVWAVLSPRKWTQFFGLSRPRGRACRCGRELPALEWYCFRGPDGRTVEYLLGQCRRCRTMFWEKTD